MLPGSTTIKRRQIVIDAIRKCFINVGTQPKFWSNNGAQFVSHEFTQFLRERGISSRALTLHYPQSNGIAQAAVNKNKNKLLLELYIGIV